MYLYKIVNEKGPLPNQQHTVRHGSIMLTPNALRLGSFVKKKIYFFFRKVKAQHLYICVVNKMRPRFS